MVGSKSLLVWSDPIGGKSVVILCVEKYYLSWTGCRKIEAFEYKHVLLIRYGEHKANIFVSVKANSLAGHQEPLFPVVKHRNLAWFGHY